MKMPVAVTHSGTFHADDLFAWAVLNRVLSVELRRTRDNSTIDNAQIVFDVGGIYDPARGRFDHHQQEGAGARPNGKPYAAFGLVWKEYGAIFCRELGLEYPTVTAEIVDQELVSTIDAIDTGSIAVKTPVSISGLLSMFNPTWDEYGRVDDQNALTDNSFRIAANYAEAILVRYCSVVSSRLSGEEFILAAPHQNRILSLAKFVPWVEIVVPRFPDVLYVVYPSDSIWMCQAVPPSIHSFKQRKSLPLAWAGLRDQALADVTGVQDAVFWHSGRFICGARSWEGAMALAEKAVNAGKK